MTYIGQARRRMEDPRLLRGEGRFVEDMTLSGMLHAGFVRSPHAHAKILSIAREAALALPGVVAVYTAHDLELGKESYMRPVPPPPILAGHGLLPLAGEKARYMGEPVAVVLAEDPNVLADAIRAVQVDYEALQPVLDVDAEVTAAESGITAQSLVWDDVMNNLALYINTGIGDATAAQKEATVVVEERVEWSRTVGGAIESRAILVAPGDLEGVRLTIWDSTQSPHDVRQAVADYFGFEHREIRVVTPDVGGSFGPKGWLYPEEFVLPAVVLRLGRPVRWVSTRTEDMLATGHGRGQIQYATMAARADGTILATTLRVVQDVGAYTPGGVVPPLNTTRHSIGPYRVPNAAVEVIAIYSNRVTGCSVRGAGRPEGTFIVERLLDRVAEQLSIDRAEIRRRNLLRPEDFPYDIGLPPGRGGPVIYDSGNFPTYLSRALDAVDYEGFSARQAIARESGRYLGLGLALVIESTGLFPEEAQVQVGEDGMVDVSIGSPNTGQGHPTIFAQLVSDRLGVPFEAVRFSSGDTANAPWGAGTFASRVTVYGGNAVGHASKQIRESALKLASEMLEVSPDDLELNDGRISVKGFGERGVSLAEVAREANGRGEPLRTLYRFEPEWESVWAGGAHVVLLEVDVETGRVTIDRYVCVHDAGVLINPKTVDGQIHGGVAHGVGNALYERVRYGADGALMTSNLDDYKMPQAPTIPRIETIHIETPSPINAEGVKGAGEGGTIGAIPAIISGLEDALEPFGIKISTIPVTMEEIALAVRAARDPDVSRVG